MSEKIIGVGCAKTGTTSLEMLDGKMESNITSLPSSSSILEGQEFLDWWANQTTVERLNNILGKAYVSKYITGEGYE